MSGQGKGKRTVRLVTCFCIVFALIFTSLELAAPQTADAQALAQVSLDGPYLVQDLNGTFEVSASLLAGDTPVAAVSFELTYDPALISPVLITDPNEGLVGAPACLSLVAVGVVTCGPSNPNGVIRVAAFRLPGAWTNASPVDLVAIPFIALGNAGTSDLDVTITQLTDIGGQTIPGGGVGIASDVTIALPVDAIDDTGVGIVGVADVYDVAGNDVDVPAGADFSLTGVDTAVNTPSIDADTGEITYTPALSEAGSDVTIEYEVCPDGIAAGDATCDSATLTISVDPVVDAIDDTGTGVVGVGDVYDVAGNDVDVPAGADFSLTGVDTAVNTPSIDADTGDISYTPALADGGGDVAIEYEVCPDGIAAGSASCDIATLTIAIDPVVDAIDDTGIGVVGVADVYDVAGNDVDVPAGADFSLTGVDTAVNTPSIDADTGEVTYTAAASEADSDVTIQYEVCPDGFAAGSASCDTATLTISVDPIVDAIDDTGTGVFNVADTYGVAGNDLNVPAGADFSLTGVNTAANTPSIDADSGVITYTPAVAEAGSDVTVEYEVCPDGIAAGSASCDIATLTISVDVLPIDGVNDTGTGVVNVADTYGVAGNDLNVPAGADFTLTGAGSAVNTPTIDADTGVITYTPAVAEAGNDVTIEYEVCPDGVAPGSASCDIATLTISVDVLPIDAIDDTGTGVVDTADTYGVAGNDLNVPAGADFSLTGVNTAANTPSIDADSGVITYTPAVSEAGSDVTVEYEVCPDGVAAGSASCDIATLTISVDVLPIDAIDDTGTGVFNVADTYGVAGNDLNVPAGADFSLTGVDTAVNTPSIDADSGVITYTPAVSEAGSDVTVEYEVCPDGVAAGSASCDIATLTISVDVLPIDAIDDTGTGVFNVADTYGVAGNDLNVPAGADFSLTGVDTAVNTPSIDADTGVITYTPAVAEAGNDVTIEYEVCPDGVAPGSASCDIATLTISVDVLPIDAIDDTGTGVVDTADTYGVAGNDLNVPAGADFSLTGVDTAVNTPAIDADTGVITYTPAVAEAGNDVTIEYEVCPDGVAAGSASCDTATLTISVDVLPIDAIDDAGTGIVDVADVYDVAGNDLNVPAGADFTLTGVDTAVNTPAIDADTGVVSYTADAAESGSDVTVEYEVCPDGIAAGDASCDTATLTIAVDPVVDAIDDAETGVVDTADSYDVAGNDVDVPTGADFSLTGVDTAVNTPTIDVDSGVITYTPAVSEAGSDVTVEYEVCPDGVAAGSASCDTATLAISVDVLPIDAIDDAGTGAVDVADTFNVAGNDLHVPAGADFSLTGVDTAVNTPTIDADTGVITYTPDGFESGSDVIIEYEVCPDGIAAGDASCDTATLTISVDTVIPPIDAIDDVGTGVVDTADTYDVAGNDVDVLVGADFSLTGVDTAVNTPTIDPGTGVVTYTPAVAEAGSDVTIEYEVCPDGIAAGDASCDTATLTISVDVLPIDAIDDVDTGVVDVADTYAVAGNDLNVPVGADFTLTGVDTAVNTPTIDPDSGVMAYTPAVAEAGSDVTVEYEVCPDGVAPGSASCDIAILTISVDVLPIDAIDDAGTGIVGVADVYDVADNDLNVPAGADFTLTGVDTAVNTPTIDADTGVITYTPDAAESGSDVTIEYEVCPDGVAAGDASCDTATLTIAIDPVVDAIDDAETGVVDTADSYDVAGNDVDVPTGADFSLTGVDTAVNTPTIDVDSGVITYTPAVSEAGSDVAIEYEVCPDGVAAGSASCDIATLTISVDVLPIDAIDDADTGVVDVADTYDVAGNDLNVPAGADFSLTGVDTAVNTPTIDADTGVVSYTPDASESGADVTIEYEVCPDGIAAGDASCDTATLTISVDTVIPPIDAIDDVGTGVVDTADTYDVAGNDVDVLVGADFSLTGVDTAVNTPTIDPGTGVITYTPAVAEAGSDVTIEYEVCPDGIAAGDASCDTATLTISVDLVIPPIDAVDDVDTGVVDVADTYDVAGNDLNVPVGADFTLTGVDTAVNTPTIDADTGVVSYTPDASESGADVTVEYEVCPDGVAAGDASCDTATLTISVDLVIPPIDAVDDADTGVVDVADTYDVAGNDLNVPVGADFTLTGVDTAVNTPTIDADTGVVSYTPDASESGADVTVEYEVCPDGVAAGDASCDTATLTISVDLVIPPIDAVDDADTGVVDVADTYDVAGNDLNVPVGADFTLTGVDTAVNTPTIDADTGVVSYTPDASESGSDVTVEYEVCPDGVAAGDASCDTATLTISVDLMIPPIDAVDDADTGVVDTADTYDVGGNDLNVPVGADFSLTGVTTAVNTPTIDVDTGVITYTPDASESGADVTVEYEVCPDGIAAGDASCDTATLTISVDTVIPPIDAVDDADTGTANVADTFDVAANDVDVPADADFSLTGVTTAVNTPTIDADTGVITYTPDAAESGADVTIEYEVCPDGIAAGDVSCDTATLTIAVSSLTAADETSTGEVGVAADYDVSSNDLDVPAGAQYSFTGNGTVAGTPTIAADTGVITYTPQPGEGDSLVTIEYEVCPAGVSFGTSSPACGIAVLTIAVDTEPPPIDLVNDVGDGGFDVANTYNVTENDNDIPIDAEFTLPGTGNGIGATAIDPDTGAITYTPVESEASQDVTVVYEVCPAGTAAGDPSCDTAVLTITVADLPVDAIDDTGTGIIGESNVYDVAVNDIDVPASADFFLTTDGNNVGATAIDPNTGDITYTPATAEAGQDVTVIYEVCPNGIAAGSASCDTATLTIAVEPAIVANDDSTTGEVGTAADVLAGANDDDVPTGAVFSLISDTGAGTPVIDPATGAVSYTPQAGDEGLDITITYEVCPAGVGASAPSCDTADVVVAVAAAIPPIQLVDDEGAGEIGVEAEYSVVGNDLDVPVNADFSINNHDGLGTPTINPNTGVVTYTPVDADIGSDVVIAYEACPDGVAPGDATCDTAILTITIPPITGTADTGTGVVGTATAHDVAANDQDVPPGSDFRISGGTATGVAEIDEDTGVITYTPADDEGDRDVTVIYEVCPDGAASGSPSCAAATLTISVQPVGAQCPISSATNDAAAGATDAVCYNVDVSVWYDADTSLSVDADDQELAGFEVGLYAAGADGVLGTTDDTQVAITTTIADAAGNAAAGANVANAAVASTTGTFAGVAPGEYEVRLITTPAGLTGTVDPDGAFDGRYRVNVVDSDVADLQFAFAPASLVGAVLFNGVPTANVEVAVTDSNGNTFTEMSDASGRYEVVGTLDDPLYPGLASIRATIGGATVTSTVIVVGASTTTIDVTRTVSPSAPVASAPSSPQLASPTITNPPPSVNPPLAVTPAPENPLAHTGTEAQRLATVAMLILGLGGFLTVASRRIRNDDRDAS